MNKRVLLALIFSLFVSTAHAAPVPPAKNKDGSNVSGFLTADFDPLGGGDSISDHYLAFRDSLDLTLNIPVDDPNNFADPSVALNALDGFSTTEKWITTFSSFPNKLDSSSVTTGQSVRMFEVSTVFGTVIVVRHRA